jgi:sortase A
MAKQKTSSFHKRARNKFIRKCLIGLLLAVGVGIGAYPFIINSVNQVLDQKIVDLYAAKTSEAYQKAQKARLEKDAAKSATNKKALADPFNEKTLQAGAKSAQAVVDNEGFAKHTIGVIYLPKINEQLPIFDSLEDEYMAHGTGWLNTTDYPSGGKDTHAVISGHRGLAGARLFTNLPELKNGDVFIVKLGKQYHAYKLFAKHTVLPANTKYLAKQPGKDMMSLITCTPLMVNSHRLILTGERVPFTPNMLKQVKAIKQHQFWENARVMAILALAVAGIIYFLYKNWVIWQLKKRPFTLKLQALHSTTGEPIEGVPFELMDKKGKHPVIRDGQPVTQLSNLKGIVEMENLPGMNYRVHINRATQLVVFVKRRRAREFTLRYKKRRNGKIKVHDGLGEIRIQRI